MLASQAFGCDLYTKPDKDVLSEGTVVSVQSLDANNKLDLLFVIDNSVGMDDEQAAFSAAQANLFNALANTEGGVPDLHLAVLSTNMGVGGSSIPGSGIAGCEGSGDDGKFLGSECIDGSFLIDQDDGIGGSIGNYDGQFEAALSCMTAIGNRGCGFEQPLEAMRRALDGSNPENAGFLRDDAMLAVIIMSDEDDCSAFSTEIYSTDPNQDRIDSELGYLSSFRCFEFGVECDEDETREPGARTNCRPRTDSPYLYDVQEYVSFLRGLKPSLSDIFVAGIIGADSDISVVAPDGEPQLERACASQNGEALPPVRLKGFLDGFRGQSLQGDICADAFPDINTSIGELLGDSMQGRPCLYGQIQSVDACIVQEVRGLQTDLEIRREVPVCDASDPAQSSFLPCYRFELDRVSCPDTETGLLVRAEYGAAERPADVDVVVTCPVE